MGMNAIAPRLLARFGFRKILVVNTVLIGCTITLYALVAPGTPAWLIATLGLLTGSLNSMQFTAVNSMAYADIAPEQAARASTLASTFQQMSISFGLACGSMVAAFSLGGLPQTDQMAVASALHHAFLTLACVTVLSSIAFWGLRPEDGESVSKGRAAA